jgi:hypothetical protein
MPPLRGRGEKRLVKAFFGEIEAAEEPHQGGEHGA